MKDLQNLPRIIVGCMRLNRKPETEIAHFLEHALEKNLYFFDHADIYGGGNCETIFGNWLKHNQYLRDEIVLQSKCSIIPGKRYDCSKSYILQSVDGILKRLQTDYIDILLLHRPDALLEPEEVAAAFDELEQNGKVRAFGVSNFNTMQIQLLQKYCRQKIAYNQVQCSVAHTNLITSGMENNMYTNGAINRDGYTLDFCRLHDIQLQAWSPLQYGLIEGTFLDHPNYAALNETLSKFAKKYHVSKSTIAIAWILRHPAHMQVVSGSMTHFDEIAAAQHIHLTGDEWYEIYLSNGNILP